MNFTASITGNLVKSEFTFSKANKPLWRGRVAVNHRRKNQQGTYEDSGTSWVSVTAFGHLAENAANKLQDRTLVSVSGRMETREWEKDGNKGASLEMIADTLSEAVLPWPDKNNTAPSAAAQSAPSDPWTGQPSNTGGGSWGTPETAPAW